ncbi:MAG: hypothetical protein A2W85_13645 [Bacteroidetes bacterium GWF2_41_31]|nr:MAG: hypothetical protein A2W85_13645 [Bacteroidetes bacterium GWF2_41_31]OFZ09597.1 MAG: hypothetical protein A2338_10350 [Bacteroidetes bacterium RIFOXYB12_FULL_41_6]
MKKIVFLLLYFPAFISLAQQTILKGDVVDEQGNPLLYATAVLLYPVDSTMTYYGITNETGHFEIKNIHPGNYILQTSYMGYQSFFKKLELPLSKGNYLGVIAMQPALLNLSEVEVSADRIPFIIKKDTIEYGAGSYQVKPDAVAEDLLKKLPGVQVDRAGNIKAQGENVQNVLVDGKEFFGNDPQVATKNLPADAIEKVQVYNKKSDETELTGIEDGTYAKTINLILKDGKKSALFGDVSAGVGTDEKYQAGAKLYRFTKKHQFAALAMLNNVNKYGFSFSDYLNFTGGLQSLMSGGGSISIGSDSDMPINFGQNINGLVTSGAAGANFTYEAHKNNRFNISYLGSGADKKLIQNTVTDNFLENGSYIQNEDLSQNTRNRAHRINFGWKNRIDSTQHLNFDGGINITNGNSKAVSFTESTVGGLLSNELNSANNYDQLNYSAKLSALYIKKWERVLRLFKLKGGFSAKSNQMNSQWANNARFFNPPDTSVYLGFQNDENRLLSYSLASSLTFKIAHFWYLVPSASAGKNEEWLNRVQGIPPGEQHVTDSLSPDFNRQYQWLRGGISVKRNTKRSQLSLMAEFENAHTGNTLNNLSSQYDRLWYFVPGFSWDYDLGTGKRLAVSFQSSVNSPTASQLLPTLDNTNPLQLYQGNRALKPDFNHNLQLNWIYFDQFSLISLFARVHASYTSNKINWSRTVMPDLSQILTLVNVADDYRAGASIDFSTPIRPLRINFNARLNEDWNQGINMVNGDQNIVTNFIHALTLKFDNRKKEKWDLTVGATLQLTDAHYSIQKSLNKLYFNFTAFTDIVYTPSEKWYLALTADLHRYNGQSFGESVYIPLLKGEITRYFLKHNRGVMIFEVYDLLDKNTGIERLSEMNYLLQRQSNTIGRYAMITLKYRLNKFDKKSGIDIQMGRR